MACEPVPGIACDVPAIMYSYSWNQNPTWTSPFPTGSEIVRYLYDTCEKFEIMDKIQLDTNVKSVVWKEEDELWEIMLDYLAPGVGDMSSSERRGVREYTRSRSRCATDRKGTSQSLS